MDTAAVVRLDGHAMELRDLSGAGMRIQLSADRGIAAGERADFELEIRHPRDEADRAVWTIGAICAWRTTDEAGFGFEIPDEVRRGIERMLARIFATGAVKVVNGSE